MWPVIYALGSRFSHYLVLPFAAVIGTVGYYAEKKLFPKQKKISYLEASIQDQREQRQAESGGQPYQVPNTLGILKPRPVEE